MTMGMKRAVLDCGCCGGCPCCPGWPLTESGIIKWTTKNLVIDDCNPLLIEQQLDTDFGCGQAGGGTAGQPIWVTSEALSVKVFCEVTGGVVNWRVQYNSPATSPWPGPGFGDPNTWLWVDVDYEFTCPDCDESGGSGIATGLIRFIGVSACDTSGGIVYYDVDCEGIIQIGCPT